MSAAVSKEDIADSLLEYERSHHKWFLNVAWTTITLPVLMARHDDDEDDDD